MRAGMPTVRAAERLADKFRDIAWWTHERERVAAELDPHRQPVDLNAQFPLPKRVLRARDSPRPGMSGCGGIGECAGRFVACRLRWNNSAWVGRA
jgi:hypothetical protein